MNGRCVFISGGTGYLGRTLAEHLVSRGHTVRVLARQGSERKVPAGAETVSGDALDARTFAERVAPADTLVHLTGVSHPAPWKERQFRTIDLASLRESAAAAKAAGVAHFVYVSVAQPAPVMKAYLRVRHECETILREGKMPATILRPWYVLGPGHRWPVVLKPVYALLERFESTRAAALRLGLVTHAEMIAALIWAVEHPAGETRIVDVPAIRELAGKMRTGPRSTAGR
jgi:uncharacterized protein YbjT (DUF2867 family)